MRILVFASYKGGVGRTYAAVSVANTLVRYGKNVLLIDMDIDAPGLPSLYGKKVWESQGAPQQGIVPWLSGESGELADNLIEDDSSHTGRLRILPAGPVGPHYAQSLLEDQWRDKIELDPEGFCRGIRRDIEALDDPPDVVIVDTRAGLVPTTGAITNLLGDAVAFVFAGDSESIEIANMLASARGKGVIIPVLSRFPNYLDPELAAIADKLDALTDKEGLQFLHGAPGHEGSSIPTIGLTHIDNTSPLTLAHFRLMQHLIPELVASPPENDPELSRIWERASRTLAMDYKLFRVVTKGYLVNPSDAERNVAFRVSTIASILRKITCSLPEGGVETAFRVAGGEAGTAFGTDLATLLADITDLRQRLGVWCDFDTATGFGNMEPIPVVNTDPIPVVTGYCIRIENAFLNKSNGGWALLEGYLTGVIHELVASLPEPMSLWSEPTHTWSVDGETLDTMIPVSMLG